MKDAGRSRPAADASAGSEHASSVEDRDALLLDDGASDGDFANGGGGANGGGAGDDGDLARVGDSTHDGGASDDGDSAN
jgi:hypothetical protein